jgi:hypothetical protein
MSAELVPIVDPSQIADLPVEERGIVITKALEESKSWLAVATQATDPTPIAEFKAWAATVAEMARQKGLAEDIQLDALEMVRRAERGIGVAIRNGQAAGTILRTGQHLHRSNQYVRRDAALAEDKSCTALEAAKVKHHSELSRLYELTDGVTEERFEEALGSARDEHNVAHANVVRKIHGSGRPMTRLQKAEKIRAMAAEGYSSRQMAGPLATSDVTIRNIARDHGIEIRADRIVGKTRHIDPERVVRETVHALDGLKYGLNLLTASDYDELHPEQIRDWLNALDEPARAIRHLIKELKTRA